MIRVAAALLLLTCPADARTDGAEGLRGAPVALRAAVAEAQERLPEFVAALRQQSGERFSLRAGFKTWNNRIEQLWLDEVQLADDGFSGVLADRPRAVVGIRVGQRLLVEAAQVTDWAFMRDGRQLGAFTQRALDTWMLERAQR
jgi:uncharacterized protein YegJ (DUF2314 family)